MAEAIYPTDTNGARALRCVTDGRVIPLSELRDGVYSRRIFGDGYAVISEGSMVSKITEYFTSPKDIEVRAPADGVVTAADRELSIRTGDGINISVVLGRTKPDFIPDVGEKLRYGDIICTIPRENLENNGINGAVVVLFTDTDRITELHVSEGKRKAGDRAAFYRVLREHRE